MNANFIIWLAGFFDGEGCISMYLALWKPDKLRSKGRGRYVMQISIINTALDVLQLTHEIYGGKLYRHSKGRWARKLCGRDLQRRFLNDLSPSMRIKARQAQLAFDYLDTVLDDKKHGYHPISDESQAIRKHCFEEMKLEKAKYSTKGYGKREL